MNHHPYDMCQLGVPRSQHSFSIFSSEVEQDELSNFNPYAKGPG